MFMPARALFVVDENVSVPVEGCPVASSVFSRLVLLILSLVSVPFSMPGGWGGELERKR